MFRFFVVGCCDFNSTVIFDFNGSTRFVSQCTNNGTALTDNIFDLLRIDLDGMDTWSEFRDITTWRIDRLFHHTQNVQTCTLSLIQGHLHNFAGDAFNLNIHLQSSDTFAATRNFEVHVAQMIFVTQNVRQYDEVFVFFNQPHRDTGNGSFDRNTCVHQC